MLLDWNGYHQQVLGMAAELGRSSPGTVRGYRELGDAGAKKDLLGAKTRELATHEDMCPRAVPARSSAFTNHHARRCDARE